MSIVFVAVAVSPLVVLIVDMLRPNKPARERPRA
jgi:hypothetical protein